MSSATTATATIDNDIYSNNIGDNSNNDNDNGNINSLELFGTGMVYNCKHINL